MKYFSYKQSQALSTLHCKLLVNKGVFSPLKAGEKGKFVKVEDIDGLCTLH